MKKLFVPYEIALKLKQLNFDEECIALFDKDGEISGVEYIDIIHLNGIRQKDLTYHYPTLAPLYQQVIDWFREKHNCSVGVTSVFENSCIGCSKISSFLPHCNVDYYDEEHDDYYRCLNFAILKAINIIENEKFNII